jgi:hypothetical protein
MLHFSVLSQNTLVVLTRYNRASFEVGSIFSPTEKQMDFLILETVSKSTLEASAIEVAGR